MGKGRHDLAAVVFLLLAALKLTWGLESVIDLDLYDEADYLLRGLAIGAGGFPAPEHGPLYSLWYRALAVFFPHPVELFYQNKRILAILLPLAFYAAVRRLGTRPVIALALAGWLLLSAANLPVVFKPGQLALILMLVCLALVATTTRPRAALAFFAATFLCTYARPELAAGIPVLGLAVLWQLGRAGRARALGGTDLWIAGAAAAVAGGSWWLFGSPFPADRGRSFAAFGQHFAASWERWHPDGINPWTNHQIILQKVFGPVSSVTEAVMARPWAVLRHAAENLARLPVTLGQLFFIHYNLLLPMSRLGTFVAEAVLALAALVGGVAVGWRWLRVGSGAWYGRHRHLIGLFGLFCVPAILATLAVGPANHTIVLPAVVGAALLASAFLAGKGPGDENAGRRVAVIGLVLLIAVPSLGDHDVVPIHGQARGYRARTVSFLAGLGLPPGCRVLASGGYTIYAELDCVSVGAARAQGRPFLQFLEEERLDAVIVAHELASDERVRPDPGWQDLLRQPGAHGFVRYDVPGTRHAILVRETTPHRSPAPLTDVR